MCPGPLALDVQTAIASRLIVAVKARSLVTSMEDMADPELIVTDVWLAVIEVVAVTLGPGKFGSLVVGRRSAPAVITTGYAM